MPFANDAATLARLVTACEDGVRACREARGRVGNEELSALLGALQQEHAEAAHALLRTVEELGVQASPGGSLGGALRRLALDVRARFADDREALLVDGLDRFRERLLARFDETLDADLSPKARDSIVTERARLERAYAPLELRRRGAR